MEFIIHRVNLIEDLKKTPQEYGCEIDIRTNGSKLILNHDPFTKGDDFIDYLDEYKNKTLVLNIKESGIEDTVLKEVRLRGIKSYFLLDVEFPYLFSSSKKGERNIAVRFSEMEPIENLNLFKGKFDWVWIDTMNKFPVNIKNENFLKNHKTCLVCPSRWKRKEDISKIKTKLNNLKFKLDFVMTEIQLVKTWTL
tara:strand:- start:356 stop:940 length:585 start_codon:yes stop_codon:yes gene_type:complete